MASDDDQPPSLKVVSDNPNARADRAALWAKQIAQQKLTEFAASLLRSLAGSETETWHLFDRLGILMKALTDLNHASGQNLSVLDVKEALSMPSDDLNSSSDDYEHRRWLRSRGHDLIVQGALRLAAHKILDERPYFGGKHSTEVIADGTRMLEEAKAPIRRSSPAYPNPQVHSTSAIGATVATPRPAPSKPSDKKVPRSRQRQEFSQADLVELRKAIKARDDKRIKELTSKIGKRPPEI